MFGTVSLRSVLIALAIAAPSMGVGWVARGVVTDRIEIPRVIEQQAELCAAVTEKVAAEAVAAEQLRQFRAGELATERFIQDSQEAADDAQAERDLLDIEIEHYKQRVRTGDGETGEDREGICALDAAALELAGLRQAAEPDPAGGR